MIDVLHSSRYNSISAISGEQNDVQTAINAAIDGMTVNIPPGDWTWAGITPVNWTNKNIHVRGAGIDQTIINRNGGHGFFVTLSNPLKGHFQISDLTLTGQTTNAAILISSENYSGIIFGWRINNIKFNYPIGLGGQRAGVSIRGITYGVIDSNEFIWSNGQAIIIAAFNPLDNPDACISVTPYGNFIMSQPLEMGSVNAVYIEDNIFISTDTGGANVYDTSNGGGRAVFRYNHITGGFYYSHWTRGCEIGGILHEIYNNIWIGNSDYSAYIARLESGTGVIFNNTIIGYDGSPPIIYLDDRRAVGGGETITTGTGLCDGTKNWDGNFGDPSAPGWPCLGQVGRSPGKSIAMIKAGNKQESAPIYLWNNGSDMGCSIGGSCVNTLSVFATPSAYIKSTPHPNGDVDYVLNGNTPKPGYTPYTYPHPTRQGL